MDQKAPFLFSNKSTPTMCDFRNKINLCVMGFFFIIILQNIKMEVCEETGARSNERFLYLLETKEDIQSGFVLPEILGKLLLKDGIPFPRFTDYLTDLVVDGHPETERMLDKYSFFKEDMPFGELQRGIYHRFRYRLLSQDGCFKVLLELLGPE